MSIDINNLSVSKQELRILADSDCEAAWIGKALLDSVDDDAVSQIPTAAD